MAPRALVVRGFCCALVACCLGSGDALLSDNSRAARDQASFLGRSAAVSVDVSLKRRQIPPAPAPAPGPAPGPAMLPPCNFTYDADGVAWPADCREIPNDLQKRISCTAMVGGFFSPYCAPPPLYPCPSLPPPAPEEAGKPPVLQVYGFGQAHGSVRTITCMPHAVPVDGKYEVSSWGEAWYKGAMATTAICNNGTWAKIDPYGAPGGYLKPMGFACATRGQLKALRDMHWDEHMTRENLASAEGSHAAWLDKAANERKLKVREAQQAAADLYAKALQQEVAPERTLKTVDESMRKSNMGPEKGVKRTDTTCQDLQKHFPMEPTASVKHPFVCRYSMQKTSLGLDPITAKSTYLYRDGCFCESRWKGLCPFRADHSPKYKDFGFHSLDERPVTDGLGGPPSGALCWYWSDNLHPEYGYTSETIGPALAASPPATNSSGAPAPAAAQAADSDSAADSANSLMTSKQADESAKEALEEDMR